MRYPGSNPGFPSVRRLLAVVLAGFLATGCSTVNKVVESKKVDYKSAGKLPALEVPPDLTRPAVDDRYVIPETRGGAATFSTYERERQAKPRAGSTGILPTTADARIERSGSQRWLVVKGTPETLWPAVKEFWEEVGFIVNSEVPEAGVMETDWAENRAKVPDGMIRGFFGRALNSIYSTAERDKFRTRLERGTTADTTEVYVSHRGMIEVYADEGKDRTMWQPRPANPELEAEFLGRMMVRLGVEESRAKAMLLPGGEAPRAKITRMQDGAGRLDIADQFDRAWRRVGLALDRVGFTVEDRDRSKGLYFVRYVDPDADLKTKKDDGFLSKLQFWKSDDRKGRNEQFRVLVKDRDAGAEVNVLNKEGAVDKTDTANRILTLLLDQLK